MAIRKPRTKAAAGKSMSVPTPRPVRGGRTMPRGTATRLPDTMMPPAMKAGARRKGKRAA